MNQAQYPDVLILIPALNESNSISATIAGIKGYLPGAHILVIDNGSTDGTVEAAKRSGVEVLLEPKKGKGFAIRRGFRAMRDGFNVAVMIDGDDTYGYDQLPLAVDKIKAEGVDMVVGKRIPTILINERKPVFKKGHSIGNKFFTRFSSLLHPVGIEDSLSGWRVMSRGFVNSFSGGATGFEIEAELNAHAFLIQCSVENVNVNYVGRSIGSQSKLNTYADGLRILRMNLLLFRNNRPQIAFGILSLPWFILSAILVYRVLVGYFQSGLVRQFPSLIAGVGAFIIGVLLIVTGMILQRVKVIRSSIAQYHYKE